MDLFGSTVQLAALLCSYAQPDQSVVSNAVAELRIGKGLMFQDLGEISLKGFERRAPPAPLPSMNPIGALAKAAGSGLRATWLGHSTVLIEIDGVRCSPTRSGGRGLRRRDSRAPSASSRCPFPFMRCRR
jgi:hypothetical protein